MRKVDWLFKETNAKERILLDSVELNKEKYQNKILHELDGWRGVYYENESDLTNKIVVEFEINRDDDKILNKIESLFVKK